MVKTYLKAKRKSELNQNRPDFLRSNMEMRNFYANQLHKRKLSAFETSCKQAQLKQRLLNRAEDERKRKLLLHYKWAFLKEKKWEFFNEAVERREKYTRMNKFA